MYASCLGFSLEPAAVRTRALAIKNEGYRYQKWFMGYGPGSGPEGMRKNVELVRILRETVGDDTELMFDAYSGWTQNYALEWAHQVEQYRPYWIEEATHPEKIDSFAVMHRSTTIPIASGEHFYGRWEVERYLEAGGLSVVQAGCVDGRAYRRDLRSVETRLTGRDLTGASSTRPAWNAAVTTLSLVMRAGILAPVRRGPGPRVTGSRDHRIASIANADRHR